MLNLRPLLALVALFLSQNVVVAQNKTLREIIDSDPDFSTLGQAIDAVELDFDDFDVPFTLFAPTNAAFSALDPVLLERLLSPGWNSHLVILLAMHLIEGALPSTDLVDGDYQAVNGETLTVEGTEISSPNTGDANLVLPEQIATNGVFYEVDRVLLPGYASVTLLSLASSEGFSILFELLVATGLDQLFISDITATVFAPNDDAFLALGDDALAFYRENLDITTLLLSGHVVANLVVPAVSVNLGPIELPSAADGFSLIFQSTLDGNDNFVYSVNDVEVIMPDVLAIDGIAHVLNEVIAVPGTAIPATPVAEPAPSPVVAPVETPVDTPSPYPVSAPVDKPTKEPKEGGGEGMGMMEKKDKEGMGMMDKISKGMDMGMSSEGKGMSSGGKGMSSGGKGMSSESTGKGMGSDSSSGKGMGSKGEE